MRDDAVHLVELFCPMCRRVAEEPHTPSATHDDIPGHLMMMMMICTGLLCASKGDGTELITSTLAARFWQMSLTVTFMPFQSLVALAMSSPTFLGDCAGSGISETCNDLCVHRGSCCGKRDVGIEGGEHGIIRLCNPSPGFCYCLRIKPWPQRADLRCPDSSTGKIYASDPACALSVCATHRVCACCSCGLFSSRGSVLGGCWYSSLHDGATYHAEGTDLGGENGTSGNLTTLDTEGNCRGEGCGNQVSLLARTVCTHTHTHTRRAPLSTARDLLSPRHR